MRNVAKQFWPTFRRAVPARALANRRGGHVGPAAIPPPRETGPLGRPASGNRRKVPPESPAPPPQPAADAKRSAVCARRSVCRCVVAQRLDAQGIRVGHVVVVVVPAVVGRQHRRLRLRQEALGRARPTRSVAVVPEPLFVLQAQRPRVPVRREQEDDSGRRRRVRLLHAYDTIKSGGGVGWGLEPVLVPEVPVGFRFSRFFTELTFLRFRFGMFLRFRFWNRFF